jgi:hypothetical protein
MKESELRNHAICSLCGNKIGTTGLPLFWTVNIKRHGILMDAVQRQSGLTAMLGGNAAIASAMGADEEMTQELDSVDLTVCEKCGKRWDLIGRWNPCPRLQPGCG